MKVFEGLAQAIAAEGPPAYLFGLIGGGTDRFIAAMTHNTSTRWIPTRHEQAAVGMADGFARASGEVAVATVSHGPGLTNAATHMTAARIAKSPLLVVCSDFGPLDRRTSPMYFDQEPFLRATIGQVTTVVDPLSLKDDLDFAYRQLRSGVGPIALNVPAHVEGAELPEDWFYEPRRRFAPKTRVAPDRDGLKAALDKIQSASRVAILAGRGAVLSEAREALAELADRTGAILTTSLLAREFFRGYPSNAGISGGFGAPSAQGLLQDADLVLVFGASLNDHTTSQRSVYSQACVVQIDIRREAFDVWMPADVAVLGDCRVTAEMLNAALAQKGHRAKFNAPADDLVGVDAWEGVDVTPPASGVNPHYAVRLLNRTFPSRRLAGTDVGWFMGIPGAHMEVEHPEDLFVPWFFGGIGSGLSEAMGATLARPELASIYFIGDGGLMLALSDLETVGRERIPMLVVVVDDGGFGAERPRYARLGIDQSYANYENPDMASIAASFGLRSFLVTGHAALERAVQEITATPESAAIPTLLHLIVERGAPAPEMARAYGVLDRQRTATAD